MRRDIFQAIADPTRRAILMLLAAQSMTPNAIAEHFDTTRQAVSKHIQILAECGAVHQQRSGREIHYQANPKKMKDIDLWLERFRKQCEASFNQLDDLLKEL
jgi:DNA-binding transcriptional ArsR family regulator